MDQTKIIYQDLTAKIIGVAIEVLSNLRRFILTLRVISVKNSVKLREPHINRHV